MINSKKQSAGVNADDIEDVGVLGRLLAEEKDLTKNIKKTLKTNIFAKIGDIDLSVFTSIYAVDGFDPISAYENSNISQSTYTSYRKAL